MQNDVGNCYIDSETVVKFEQVCWRSETNLIQVWLGETEIISLASFLCQERINKTLVLPLQLLKLSLIDKQIFISYRSNKFLKSVEVSTKKRLWEFWARIKLVKSWQMPSSKRFQNDSSDTNWFYECTRNNSQVETKCLQKDNDFT